MLTPTLSPAWLRQACNNIITTKHKVWIGYSGGVDSHVLLYLAKQAFSNLAAIHINDHSSPHCDEWQQHCAQVCSDLNVQLECHTVDLNAIQSRDNSLETKSRLARRMVWQNKFTEKDILLLAHQADDQAETILFRLIRGAGPHGLSGMHKVTRLGACKILRPMLQVDKQSLIKYAHDHALNWIEDRSNQDLQHDRNYLRHAVLPVLQQRWPQAIANINRAGTLCKQLLQQVQPQVQDCLNKIADHNTLDLQHWHNLDPAFRTEVLRAWLLKLGINPSLKRLAIIEREVINARADAQPIYFFKHAPLDAPNINNLSSREDVYGSSLSFPRHALRVLPPTGIPPRARFAARASGMPLPPASPARACIQQFVVRRSNNRLYFLSYEQIENQVWETVWDLKHNLQLPTGQHLKVGDLQFTEQALEKLACKNISVRMGIIGRKAKKIFQQYSIPPWERLNYPLIFADQRLVSVVGLWSSSRV